MSIIYCKCVGGKESMAMTHALSFSPRLGVWEILYHCVKERECASKCSSLLEREWTIYRDCITVFPHYKL